MSNASRIDLEPLRRQIQHNCHLSDAHHARDYSLCIYLLKMREFYRWEQGLGFAEPIPKGPLGEWLTAREQLWSTLEEQDYLDLSVNGATFSAFDTAHVNAHLIPQGLVYSGGLCGNKPHFFLAELERHERQQGITIYLGGRELIRELSAPPALSLNRVIFLRRESLRRMIWEKLEEWGWQDPQRAIARAIAHYPFAQDRDRGLEAMTDMELGTLLQHELGEVLLGEEWGDAWERLLSTVLHTRCELQLRAIRDHLVDCRHTLPSLQAQGNEAGLHFYMANLGGMRKALFPALIEAYQRWLNGDGGKAMHEAVARGADHWLALAQHALAAFRDQGDQPEALRHTLTRREEALAL